MSFRQTTLVPSMRRGNSNSSSPVPLALEAAPPLYLRSRPDRGRKYFGENSERVRVADIEAKEKAVKHYKDVAPNSSYWVVWSGRQIGIFTDPGAAESSYSGYSHAGHCSAGSFGEAKSILEAGLANTILNQDADALNPIRKRQKNKKRRGQQSIAAMLPVTAAEEGPDDDEIEAMRSVEDSDSLSFSFTPAGLSSSPATSASQIDGLEHGIGPVNGKSEIEGINIRNSEVLITHQRSIEPNPFGEADTVAFSDTDMDITRASSDVGEGGNEVTHAHQTTLESLTKKDDKTFGHRQNSDHGRAFASDKAQVRFKTNAEDGTTVQALQTILQKQQSILEKQKAIFQQHRAIFQEQAEVCARYKEQAEILANYKDLVEAMLNRLEK